MSDDDAYMARALAAGRRMRGATAENPAVGCVIVGQGRVLAVASTARGGRPHAETRALAMAGPLARGACCYVSLEPCCHHGRTPPCTDALIAAGVARIVTALEDPDPRVSGKGHAVLRAAGIEVETGVCAQEAARDLRGFLRRITSESPYVTLKLAVSADGKIAAKPGEETAITGPAARDRVHLMRAGADAILVGVSTVLADDPDLTCRLPGLEDRSPVRVVSDSRLTIPLSSRLVATARQVPVIVMTTDRADPDAAAALAAAGVTVIPCRATADGKVDLCDMLHTLAGRGISHVLAEGGAHMARALLEAGLVDEVVLLTAPKPLGPGGLAALAGLPLDVVRASRDFRELKPLREKLGPDRMEVFVKGGRRAD